MRKIRKKERRKVKKEESKKGGRGKEDINITGRR